MSHGAPPGETEISCTRPVTCSSTREACERGAALLVAGDTTGDAVHIPSVDAADGELGAGPVLAGAGATGVTWGEEVADVCCAGALARGLVHAAMAQVAATSRRDRGCTVESCSTSDGFVTGARSVLSDRLLQPA
jgi:predicted TIM-barrel enzyme